MECGNCHSLIKAVALGEYLEVQVETLPPAGEVTVTVFGCESVAIDSIIQVQSLGQGVIPRFFSMSLDVKVSLVQQV